MRQKTSSPSSPVPATPEPGSVLVSGQPITYTLKSGDGIVFDNEIARGIYTPSAQVPDDNAEEYRETPGTCGVLVGRVLRREMSPAEIAGFPPVRGTEEREEMSSEHNFKPLAAALDGWFGRPLVDLPRDLRNRVEGDPFLALWDTLADDQRRDRAAEWDYEHDPTRETQRQRDWDEYRAGWEEHWRKVPLLTAKEFCCLRRIHDPRNFDDERKYIPEGASKSLGKLLNDDLRIVGRGAKRSRAKPLAEWVTIADEAELKVPEYLREAPVSRETADVGQADAGDEQPAGAAPECADFRSMRSLTADELTVKFVAGGLLEITARKKTHSAPLASLGLIDLRNGGMNRQGSILLDLACGRRVVYSPKKAKTMSRLREVFERHLGVKAPFDAYRKGAGWEPRFKVVDKRNAAADRAKREGERRTGSFDEMQAEGAQFRGTSQDYGEEADTDASRSTPELDHVELDRLIKEQKQDR